MTREPDAMQRLRHVVMFGFTDGTTPEQLDEIVARFAALKGLIEGIDSFEWGTNVSPEGLNQGLTHCFVLTFATEAARDAYLPHPEHMAFVEFIKPFVTTVTVVDYWAEGR